MIFINHHNHNHLHYNHYHLLLLETEVVGEVAIVVEIGEIGEVGEVGEVGEGVELHGVLHICPPEAGNIKSYIKMYYIM